MIVDNESDKKEPSGEPGPSGIPAPRPQALSR
jgi:hypothetical protein